MKKINNNFNSFLNINLSNIKINYNNIKKLNSNFEIAACVKANAYGLGFLEICKFLVKQNCKSFFVATTDEALLLRNKYKKIDIYLLNGVNSLSECKTLAKNNIIIVINNMQQFDIVKKTFKYFRCKIKSALHFDTGMNRLGLSDKYVGIIFNHFDKYIDLKLVMSHMIKSEKKSSLNNSQLRRFENIKKKIPLVKNLKYSLSNSNAVFLGEKYHFDLVRVGGFLYGLELSNKNYSKNVLTLKAKIIQIENVLAGNSVGYGANYVVKKDSKIATLAIGYADGIPRDYKGYAIYRNKKVNFVGNISMDLSCIDVTKLNTVRINDWVEIFGDNLSIYTFANYCKTIPYEISCKIGSRVKRIYNI